MRSRSLLALSWALVATLGVAPSARAEPEGPALPAGFVAASPVLRKPTVRPTGRSSLQSNHEFTFSIRDAVPGQRADIAALPVLDLEPADLSEPVRPDAMPAGSPGDLVVLKAAGDPRLSIQGFEAGVMHFGHANPIATGRQSSGGIPKACGPKAQGDGITPIQYRALRRADAEGNLELVMGRGWVDTASCQVVTTRRLTVKPAHLGGGIVYAFKTRCAACAGGPREDLHVLTPQNDRHKFKFFVPFEIDRLRLARGISGAFAASTGSISTSFIGWGLPDWDGLVKRRCAVDRTFCFTDVRFEVSWGMGEDVPTAYLAGDFLKKKDPPP